MARLIAVLLNLIVFLPGLDAAAVLAQSLTLPSGTTVDLVATRPVWAKTARAGDPLYAQTNFPVSVANQIVLPAGTYVESRIVSLTPPKRFSAKAKMEILSSKLIFANGYVVLLNPASGPGSVLTDLTLDVSRANDLLLDNGAQFHIQVPYTLSFDAKQVSAAIALSRSPSPGQFRTATLCRPYPGSPGTPASPDTVIPGSSGTPSITVPGANGAPDTVIPGIPPSPPTVIPGAPGTPGTPATVCPSPPLVISSTPAPLNSPSTTP